MARRARRGDPWAVRLAATRQAVAALRARPMADLPADLAEVLASGAREAERFTTILLEHHAGLTRAPFSHVGEALAYLLAVLIECDPGCPHTGKPKADRLPLYLLLAHRRLFCRRCLAGFWLVWPRPAPRIPKDRCDWCEEPTRVFREQVIHGGALIALGNACETCHRALHQERSEVPS